MSKVFFDEVSGGTVSSEPDAFSVTNTGSGPALRGESVGGFTAVFGTSKQNGLFGETNSDRDSGVVGINNGNGFGVTGSSNGGEGVHAHSDTGNAVHGDSAHSDAIVGLTLASGKAGVLGLSPNGNAVAGISDRGTGVFGKGGKLAGAFEGNVVVTGSLTVQGLDLKAAFDDVQVEIGDLIKLINGVQSQISSLQSQIH
jgi:hypothetical protein